MLYGIKDGQIANANIEDLKGYNKYFGLMDINVLKGCAEALNIPDNVFLMWETGEDAEHRSNEGFDVFVMTIPELDLKVEDFLFTRTLFYFCPHTLLCICDTAPEYVVKNLQRAQETNEQNLDRILYWILEASIKDDNRFLQRFESEIDDLNDAVMEGGDDDECREQMSFYRRKLAYLKQYYERLSDIADNLVEDENELIGTSMDKYINNYQNKVERLLKSVLNLRDYMAQIREAFQAETDLKLNGIMKVFTVLTSIFMPLTLITSWYGMNLAMPETQARYTYPVIIGLSVIVVLVCIIIFKKRKWF